ncbi:MAG: hypothetical protein AB1611_07285 [bacterium]
MTDNFLKKFNLFVLFVVLRAFRDPFFIGACAPPNTARDLIVDSDRLLMYLRIYRAGY